MVSLEALDSCVTLVSLCAVRGCSLAQDTREFGRRSNVGRFLLRAATGRPEHERNALFLLPSHLVHSLKAVSLESTRFAIGDGTGLLLRHRGNGEFHPDRFPEQPPFAIADVVRGHLLEYLHVLN